MKLNELLNGLELGQMQKAGVMSVIPLLNKEDNITNSLASFEDITFHGTSGYGTMVFENKSDKPFIMPTGYSVITKQLAQDHGMTFASLLKPLEKQFLDNTCCIEQTQGGFIDGNGVEGFNLLPLYVRKKHMEQFVLLRQQNNKETLEVSNGSFSRLWPIISEFQRNLVKEDRAHLVFFFTKFVDELTQFNAEFEVVDRQRGAIIMLNDKIVGIEIAPSCDYWKKIWNSLIRDCYGSEVLRLLKSDLIKEFKKSEDNKLDLSSATTISEIRKSLREHQNKEVKSVQKELDLILNKSIASGDRSLPLVKRNSQNNLDYHIFKVENERSYGEVYTEKGEVVYASLLF